VREKIQELTTRDHFTEIFHKERVAFALKEEVEDFNSSSPEEVVAKGRKILQMHDVVCFGHLVQIVATKFGYREDEQSYPFLSKIKIASQAISTRSLDHVTVDLENLLKIIVKTP
jgi:hypothetical protein